MAITLRGRCDALHIGHRDQRRTLAFQAFGFRGHQICQIAGNARRIAKLGGNLPYLLAGTAQQIAFEVSLQLGLYPLLHQFLGLLTGIKGEHQQSRHRQDQDTAGQKRDGYL
ncbi:hypothetical protein AFK24_29470 [Pseudomonas syringae]|uniref:Uncharacterized protein n=1 Tax=Pseudomonas syringae TaxID=317 RepID=A0A1C7YVA7_PSESX|nr:hypothetical protein AFK24_29470 [Pseudomonas syringae]